MSARRRSNSLRHGLAGSDLHSVLLEVMQHRARSRTPADVLAQYLRDGFCAPAAIDLRTSHEVDGHLLAAADAFEALDLSPVAPLGVSSAIAQTGQNRVLSALRMTEVVSDPTNVLALECARRLRADRGARFTSRHASGCSARSPSRSCRGTGQHFRIFVLASGGREAKDHAFTVQTCALHIRTMLRALDRLEQHGYGFGARRVEILTTPAATGHWRSNRGIAGGFRRSANRWSTPITRQGCGIRSGSPHRTVPSSRWWMAAPSTGWPGLPPTAGPFTSQPVSALNSSRGASARQGKGRDRSTPNFQLPTPKGSRSKNGVKDYRQACWLFFAPLFDGLCLGVGVGSWRVGS